MRDIPYNIPEFFQSILKDPYSLLEKTIALKKIKIIHDEFIKIYKDHPNIINLKSKADIFNDTLIIGDIHGDFHSLNRIIKPFLEEKAQSMIFLGDYVDRGTNSYETLILVLILAITWPERIILLRGNHEDTYVNEHFSFIEELRDKYRLNPLKSRKILQLIDDIFDYLSIMAITPKETLCVHAGIPIFYLKLADFQKIPKPHSLIEIIADNDERKKIYDIFMQVRWNDSSENQLRNPLTQAFHGFYFYTQSQVEKFLNINGIKRIVKSHETRRGGFENLFDGKLLHIFSTEPYFDQIDVAYTLYESKLGKIFLCNLDFEQILNLDTKEERHLEREAPN